MFFIDDHLKLSWWLFDADFLAIGSIEVIRLPVDDIDESSQPIVLSNRHLHSRAANPKFLPCRVDGAPWIGAHPVQFVDEDHPGHVVTQHLLVDSEGLGLNSSHAAENKDRAV